MFVPNYFEGMTGQLFSGAQLGHLNQRHHFHTTYT